MSAAVQSPPAEDAPRFASNPGGLRRPSRTHRLSYIIEALPAGLGDLAAGLDVAPDARILDFGCADQPYRGFFPAGAEYVGADLPGNPAATIEIAADGTLPVADASVDVVLSTQVLEHVADPAVHLAECFRVLRPGGRLLLSTHGIMVWHPDPVDLWRWTGEGLQRTVTAAGFAVDRFEGIMGLAATGLQLVQDAVYWHVPRVARPVLAFVVQSLIRVADRLQSAESRRMNALVYALVATKP